MSLQEEQQIGRGGKYSLSFIQSIEFYKEIDVVGSNIQNIINDIARRVGAPTYNKTPIFKKNFRGQKAAKSNRDSGNHNANSRLRAKIENDWSIIRNYEETVLAPKKEGIELSINQIRSNLNKLSNDTYDNVKKLLFEQLRAIDGEENQERVAGIVFETATTNLFWCKIYAKLYNEISKEFPIYKKICMNFFEKMQEKFENIDWVDPETDYDKFCIVNKENEHRRAMSRLFIGLCEENMIEKQQIINLIRNLIQSIHDFIDFEGNVNIVDEIGENLKILIGEGHDICSECEEWSLILNDVELITEMKTKEHVSLTKKMVFKMMDLMEKIDD